MINIQFTEDQLRLIILSLEAQASLYEMQCWDAKASSARYLASQLLSFLPPNQDE